MKTQTFIAIFKNAEGMQTDFERFCDKKISTVERKLREYLGKWSWLYSDAKIIEIYATPDGYTYDRNSKPESVISLADL